MPLAIYIVRVTVLIIFFKFLAYSMEWILILIFIILTGFTGFSGFILLLVCPYHKIGQTLNPVLPEKTATNL